jgi:hypothetical protein
VVDQIKAADPKDETGYGKKLVVTAKFVDFYTEFQGLLAKQDFAGAIAFIEKSAASGDFEVETKQEVIQSKIWTFICMKKFDDAIKAVEEAKAVAPESELARRIDKYWPSEIEKEKAKAGAKP